jgi:hypothetical protein
MIEVHHAQERNAESVFKGIELPCGGINSGFRHLQGVIFAPF